MLKVTLSLETYVLICFDTAENDPWKGSPNLICLMVIAGSLIRRPPVFSVGVVIHHDSCNAMRWISE